MSEFSVHRTLAGHCLALDGRRIAGGKPDYRGDNCVAHFVTAETYAPVRTCEVECYDDGVDEALDGEWHSYAPPTWYLSCGHTVEGADRPRYCSTCGARVKEV